MEISQSQSKAPIYIYLYVSIYRYKVDLDIGPSKHKAHSEYFKGGNHIVKLFKGQSM